MEKATNAADARALQQSKSDPRLRQAS